MVYDVWWPWRLGRIMRRLKTCTYVRWSDGEIWRYDKAHLKYLRAL